MRSFTKLSVLLTALLLITFSDGFAQSGDFKVGGGLTYGSEVEAIGLQANGTYAFTEDIVGAADLTLFFPQNYDWWALNINAHYNFLAEEGMSVYGLGGLNYATMKVDLGQFGSASNSEAGLNLGGGAEFDVEFANLYAELKYVLGNADQLVLGAGLRFGI